MVRTLGWFLLALLGLSGLALLSMPEGDRAQLLDVVGQRALEHSRDGLGYDDGALVWRDLQPVRITVEQLPSLDGRRTGSSWNSGFLSERMSWFGVSLREAIAQCLQIPAERVMGDPALDTLWFDVDAARTRGLFQHGFGDWSAVRARILAGFLEHYGITVSTGDEPIEMKVLRAGPGWEGFLGGRSGSRVTRGDGVLVAEGMRVDALLIVFRELLGVQLGEGMDTSARCSFELRWDASDPDSLLKALAEELDLHVENAVRDVLVAHVEGVPQPPVHLR